MSSRVLRSSFSVGQISVVSPTVGSWCGAIQSFLASPLARCHGVGTVVTLEPLERVCDIGYGLAALSSCENGIVLEGGGSKPLAETIGGVTKDSGLIQILGQ